MADEIKKKIESDYQYEYQGPKQVEGDFAIPETIPEEKPLLIRDELAPSLAPAKPLKAPPPSDAPEVPNPTPKAIRKLKTKEEILQKERKRTAVPTDATLANEWVTSFSFMGAFLSKFMELLDYLRETRFKESGWKINVEAKMFELGIQNADLAKLLKDTASQKEFFRAVGSFIKSAMETFELGTTLQARQTAIDRAKESDVYKKLEAQKQTVEGLEGPIRHQQNLGPNDKIDLSLLPPQERQHLLGERKTLHELQRDYQTEFQTIIQQEMSSAKLKGQIGSSLSEGCIGVLASLYTVQEGILEKDKGRNEALLQVFNKLHDSFNKGVDDLKSQVEKVHQQIVQASSERTKSHLIGRG